MEKRIIQLESLIALQDDTIQQLNQEVFRQQRDLSRLRNELGELKSKIADLGEPERIAGDERPPHY